MPATGCFNDTIDRKMVNLQAFKTGDLNEEFFLYTFLSQGPNEEHDPLFCLQPAVCSFLIGIAGHAGAVFTIAFSSGKPG